ncbi:nitroreductase/quinone reductase family protein [Streptomyces sp. NBC_01808]|uniref:nitroreductase/quinone reductase family protein n=1 Tax=Streptomyces sp. NBC_01808 TaxID=2975947 RepID=UPI002DD79F07|nr:nitroreductase/quinone reductase family protein [Streptomyces sp. NBC_01808]WSA39860.1 nitroreductase/quinone reductase family protein [Streptomyces sp. NBC_01808]
MTTEQQPSPAEFNRRVIEEFRANGGRVGGMFEGAPLVLLTTTGSRSGTRRTNPVVYLRDGARLLVFGSNGGADHHPAWYHNLLAHPRVTVEIRDADAPGGTTAYEADAVPLPAAERDRMYAVQAGLDPAFAAYERGTARTIPVIALHPAPDPAAAPNPFADPRRRLAAGEQLLKAHEELRRELAGVLAAAEGAPADTAREPALRDLRRHCLAYCGSLEEHHGAEDGALGAMERQFPHLAPAVARIREEHRDVTAMLERVRDLAAAAPQAAADPAAAPAAAAVLAELHALAARLDAHFAYEERELLPALGLPAPPTRAVTPGP